MLAMPRPRWPHLQKQISRHGKTVWYVRRGHGQRVRLRAAYGTPEFDGEYHRAISGALAVASPRPIARQASLTGSLAWLWDRYRETGSWTSLSPATRRQRENIMLHVLEAAGAEDFASVSETDLVSARDRRSSAQGRNFLDAMRGLYRWSKKAGHAEIDPTKNVENPPRKSTGGFPAWDEADVALYTHQWPVGTPQRVWLSILLHTGLRRGDAVKLGKQHFRGPRGRIRTGKTGVEVPLFLTADLAGALERGPTGDLAFICGLRGEPMTKESFGNAFSEACRAAGIKKSAHGVRKLAATRLADAGATVHELEAVFGWHGGAMAALYTKGADRRRLAESAIQKLAIPSPEKWQPPSPMAKTQ